MTQELTVLILTYNEEIHIERCIKTLLSITNNICLIDSYSTDRTLEIAQKLGVRTFQRKWKNYADQFQWGLDHCDIKTQWVMRIDADEYLEPDLQKELHSLLEDLPPDLDGIYLKEKVFFYGRWIRHGGVYPLIPLRIWRLGKGRIEQNWMDEHIVLEPGSKTITLQNHIVDDNNKGITFWINKHNKYSSREAVDLLNLKYPLHTKDNALVNSVHSLAKRKRMLKEQVYSKLPVGLRAFFYFCYRYFLMLGFLDGGYGFIWHFMQGFWYRLLVDIKIIEIQNLSEGNVIEMKRILSEMHGLDLN